MPPHNNLHSSGAPRTYRWPSRYKMALTNKLFFNEPILTSTNKLPKDGCADQPPRKRKRGKVFTAADSTPIQARIPKAMFLEIERIARHELVSIADFVRAALLEKLEGKKKQAL